MSDLISRYFVICAFFYKRGLSTLLIGLFFFISVSTAFAQSIDTSVDELLKKAEVLELHKSDKWKRLLLYKKNPLFPSGLKSSISSQDFFISDNGRIDPYSELMTTLKEMHRPIDPQNPDHHPICRFPARFKWLRLATQWKNEETTLQKCPQYQKWSYNGKIKSISLIFASGYLGNPASYFGHPLIKFNVDSNLSNLLDVTLNFGAITPESENPFVYVTKGLLGGYDAVFSHLDYFYHHHNYTEVDLRDLWEYELNLTRDEIDLVIDHSWEMMGKKITYYFFWDNCAYRMAELLEPSLGVSLLPKYAPYAIPNNVFDGLANKKRPNGEPLYKKVSYIPSRQSRLSDKYNSLPFDSRELIKSIIKNQSTLKSGNFQSLDPKEKSQILTALFDYYSFRLVGDRDNHELKEGKRLIVLERLSLPPELASDQLTQTNQKFSNSPPHEAQRSLLTRVSQIVSDQNRSFQEFTFRPALYDFMNPEVARPQNSELTAGETTLRIENGTAELRKLEFFSVATLNTAGTDLPGDGGFAWKFQLGLKSQNIACRHCQIFGVDAGLGYSTMLGSFTTLYGMGTIQIQTDREEQRGTFALTPVLGAFFNFNPSWKTHIQIQKRAFLNGERLIQDLFEIDNRFGSSPQWDIRLSYTREKDHFGKLSFSYYF